MLLPSQLAAEMSNAPRNAVQKESTTKPLMKVERNNKIKALITKIKSPSVRMLIGNVNTTNIGLTSALKRPRKSAVIIAV